MDNNFIKNIKKLIENIATIEKTSASDANQGSHDGTGKKTEETELNSSNNSINEGPLAQFIPIRDLHPGFKPGFKKTKAVYELILANQYTEAFEIIRPDPDIINAVFFEACLSNNPNLCKDLIDINRLKEFAVNPNTKNPDGNTGLHIASAQGYTEICRMLIENAVNLDVNSKDYNNRTPLHLACIHNQLEIVQILVKSKAQLRLIDKLGNTPMDYALNNSNHLITELLSAELSNLTPKSPQDALKAIENDPSDEGSSINIPIESKYACMIEEINKVFINPYTEYKLTPKMFNPLQLLGKGSFGEVYLVEKIDSKELFAMKILSKNKILAEHLVKYVMAERNIMSSVKHPFIVSLRYSFQTNNKLYLVEDYCSGGNLKSILLREKKFSEELSRMYICEIILALEELHRKDIIYRDLKPENVVLDSQGHALLTDFGLSKQDVIENDSAHSFCGTVSYLAPEMLRRAGHGKPVDWYLVGVLLYEMLVGSPPYYSSNKQRMFESIQTGDLKIPLYVSSTCRNLLRSLLEKNPEWRLGTFEDAAEVKKHEFFKGVDWNSVLSRQLVLPIPPQKAIGEPVPQANILDHIPDVQPNIMGWTFICQDNTYL
jgi:serine/threonine protein kinase